MPGPTRAPKPRPQQPRRRTQGTAPAAGAVCRGCSQCTALRLCIATACCSCRTRGSSSLNPTFFKGFPFASVSLQKYPGSRMWGFTPFHSRKASKTVLYIPSTLALLTLILSNETRSLALQTCHTSPHFLCQKSWSSPKAEAPQEATYPCD